MKNKFKRIIALLLVTALCLSTAPFSVLAAYEPGTVMEDDGSQETIPSEVLAEDGFYTNGQVVSEDEPAPSSSPAPSAEETEEANEPNTEQEEKEKEIAALLETPGATLEVLEDGSFRPAASAAQMRRAARAANRAGTLYIGYYTFSQNIGYLESVGDSLSQTPSKTIKLNGESVNRAIYCLDHALGSPNGLGYSESAAAAIISDHNKMSLIGDILANGYQYSGNGSIPLDAGYKWAVTQLMIWQAVYGSIYRDPLTGLNVFKPSCTADIEKCASACGNYSGFFSYYYSLKNTLEKMRTIPSFAYRDEKEAAAPGAPLPLAYNEELGSYVFTANDKNKVLDHFNFTFDNSAVSTFVNGNNLRLTAAEELTGIVISQKAEYAVQGGSDSLVCFSPSDSVSQRLTMCIDPQDDPVAAYIAVQTGEAGEEPEPEVSQWRVTVTKSDSETGSTAQGDATLAGATYGIYLNGSLVGTYSTDSSGRFTTDWYDCGTGYTLREISPSTGYLLNSSSISLNTEASGEELISLTASSRETVIKGKIRLTKHTDKGETGIETPEEGAKFQVYLSSAGSYDNAKSTERDLLTIDADGVAISKNLPYGLYTVHQTEGWEGKEFVTDFQVFVCENGNTYSFILNNRVFEALITVMKKDAETGRTIPASGIGFKIRNTTTGEYVVQHINYPTPMDLSVFYTDVTGKLMLPEALEYGHYELIEVATAYGYVLNQDPVPFEVDGTAKEVVVEKFNTPQKGIINIHKEGEVFASVQQEGEKGPYIPVYAVQGLPGAEFDIIAAEDIYTPDNTLRYPMGEVVDHIVSDKYGDAASSPLYLGKYMVVEKKAPEGCVANTTPKFVTLSYAGQTIDLTSTYLGITNIRQKASINMLKSMEQDEDFQLGMNGERNNVTFALYAAEELTAADGKSIPKDGLLGTATVNEHSEAVFDVDVPCGSSLYVKEIATDEHYIISEEQWPLQFDYAGQATTIVYLHVNNAEWIPNALKRGTIDGTKVDEDGLLLGGALIGLFFPDETEFTEETAILTSTSASNGDFTFKNVPFGPWLVREITPKTGFVLNEETFPVTVSENGEHIKVAIENRFIKGSVRLEKIDEDYTGQKLSGAIFDVYADSNGNREYDAGDVKIGSLEETKSGVYTMSDLRYGGFFAIESTAPNHYILDPTPRYFEIKEDGATVELTVKNAPQLGNLLIKKVSEDGLVEGIQFTVSGKPYTGGTYKQEFETDENGKILVEGLRLGEYTVSEILDESTVRYIVQPDQTVTVSSGNTTEVKFYNKLKRGSVYVIKTDPNYPDSKLTGAEFKVYQDMDFNGKFDSNVDTFYGKLESDKGIYWLEGLPNGSFFLQESIAPMGYIRDTEMYYFEIDEDTTQIEITNTPDPDAGFVNRPITGALKIIKKAENSTTLLSGANFCVKNSDGEVVAEGTTDKNGEVLFSGLTFGKYTYQEIYAPQGYECDSTEYPFEITKNNQVIEKTVTNRKTPFYVPQTGDGRWNPTFEIILLVVLLATAGGLIVYLIRNKNKNQK